MNFDGNYRLLGEIDSAELKALVSAITIEQWAANDFRQRRYEVHKDTQTIALVYDPDFRHSHPTVLPAFEKFETALLPVLEAISAYYEESERGHQLMQQFGLGYFIRASLVNLRSGGSIAAHTDNNFSLVHSHRLHIPIITNDGVVFSVGGEELNMKEGLVYEINNRREHTVRNRGAEDRVHLILDFVLPGEKCCCGEKLHPDTLCSPKACIGTDHLKIPCTCFPINESG